MKKINQILSRFLLIIAVFLGVFASAQNDIKITEIRFTEGSHTFQLGTFTLGYKIFPENATNQNLTWESDNPDAISVRNGMISVKKAGNATITATAQDGSGVSAKFDVIGIKLIRKITFNVGEVIYLRPNGANNYPIRTSIEPFDATKQNLKWESSDDSVVSVTQNGEITTHQIGNATIKATAQDGSWEYATLKVNVIIPVEKVTINEGDITLSTYTSKQLTATILPADAPLRKLRWYSSNNQIATVDSNGMLNTRGQVGEATITAYSEDEYAGFPENKIKVTVVNQPVKDLSASSYQRDIEVKWTPSSAENNWKIVYNEKGSKEKTTKFVTTPSFIMRDLKPKTIYEIQVSVAENGASTSIAISKEAETLNLPQGNKFPHLYNIKNIKLNEVFPIFWKDLEDVNTKISYKLLNSETDAVISDVLKVNDAEKTMTITKSGNYKLLVSFSNNQQTWEELSYEITIK